MDAKKIMETRCFPHLSGTSTAEFPSDHPKFGGTSAEASCAMRESALGTFPAEFEAVDGGTAFEGHGTDGDATVEMKQDGDDCIRR